MVMDSILWLSTSNKALLFLSDNEKLTAPYEMAYIYILSCAIFTGTVAV